MFAAYIFLLVTALTFGGAVVAGSVATAGCGCPQVKPGSHDIKIPAKDGVRGGSYVAYIPSGYSANKPMPVILCAHSFGSSPEIVATYTGFRDIAELYNVIAVFPEGVDSGPGEGWAFPGCNANPPLGTKDCHGRRAACDIAYEDGCNAQSCPSASSREQSQCDDQTKSLCTDNCNWCGCENDEGFIRAIVADLQASLCIDASRIYMSGFSMGGMFTSWLAARTSDIFAGFAPVSGTNPRDFYELIDSSQVFSMLWIHGTEDHVVPIDAFKQSNDGYYYEPLKNEASRVATAFGCEPSPFPSSLSIPDVTSCQEYHNCELKSAKQGSRSVVFCQWQAGHEWPTHSDAAEVTKKFWGTNLMVKFFMKNASKEEAKPLTSMKKCLAPEDSPNLNVKTTFWNQYKFYILSVLGGVLLAALFVFFLYGSGGARRAPVQASDNETDDEELLDLGSVARDEDVSSS
eukprot:m.48223 g.48223  ORF g.48223 m.48223 type:complete len:460 (-) comp10558_c0_seq1:75-1454(-)